MSELWRLAALIRSKNAAPFEMTIDVVANNAVDLKRIVSAPAMQPAALAGLYGLDVDDVALVTLEAIHALKITLPRPVPSGDIADTDVFAGQFHSPLVCLDV